MTGIVGGGGGGGYDYVQNPEPVDPEEGEEWYETGANKAFVFDGAAWIEQTVTSHGALSDLDQDDHPQYATDNKVDSHAADADAHHSRPTGTQTESRDVNANQGGYVSHPTHNGNSGFCRKAVLDIDATGCASEQTQTFTVNYADGTSDSKSVSAPGGGTGQGEIIIDPPKQVVDATADGAATCQDSAITLYHVDLPSHAHGI
ncbi:hypothetical protein HUG10_09190 [Halorarum halophilum]|uniref:Uncharacterized protein n=1 Tax=Halorarum halophilum TaxID=2743090 RepID=A0A7D5KLQ2_9EURY|nr:hypothetical protein [Halobaculum halophilum]QLG27715.1 hypothetical protein HUG10_09190 [Halobaculum halophilum]